MLMATKKIITIFGATGGQGGGLAQAIFNDPNSEFTVRAVTRNADTEKVKALASQGAEIVVADIDDPRSLNQAFQGAYGAYCVTFYWDHFSPEKELDQARSMANAAKEHGLKHVIWSTLEDTRKSVPLTDDRMPTLMENYKVPHFDAKGEANKFFLEAGVPTTFLLTSFYWDNFINLGMGPKKGADGGLVFRLPMGEKKLSGIAVEDIGKCAYGIFKQGIGLTGKTIGVAGGHLSGVEMAMAFGRALQQDIAYQTIAFDDYRALGFPGADDLGNMFQFYHDFADEFQQRRDVEYAKTLNPELQSFETWLQRNAGKIPVE
jgi:uncharacterized protein YbjT (DUF2867 family)